MEHNHLIFCKALSLLLVNFLSELHALCLLFSSSVSKSLSLTLLRVLVALKCSLLTEWFGFFEEHIQFKEEWLNLDYVSRLTLSLVNFKIRKYFWCCAELLADFSAYIFYVVLLSNLNLLSLLSRHFFLKYTFSNT